MWSWRKSDVFRVKWHCFFFSSVFILRLIVWNNVSNSVITFIILCWRAHLPFLEMNKLVSSANKTKFAPWIFNGRPFLYSKNKRGPTIEPCGVFYFLFWGHISVMYGVPMITVVYFNTLYSVHQIWFKLQVCFTWYTIWI